VSEVVKGMFLRGMLVYFPDAVKVVAPEIGEVQVLELSPQR
jgi:hypothetical protein